MESREGQAPPVLRSRAELVVSAVVSAVPVLLGLVVLAILCHRYDLLTICSEWAKNRTVPPSLHLSLVPATAVCAGLATAAFHSWRNRAVVAVVAIVLAFLLPVFPPSILYIFLVSPPLVLLWVLFDKFRTGARLDPLLLPGTCLLLLIALAAFTRTLVLRAILPKTLDPDSIGYLQLARDSWGYDTHFREPGFIWVLQLLKFFSGADYSDAAGRLYGVFLGLGSLAVTFEVVRRFFGLLPALVAGTFYAMGSELTFVSARVLREDTIIASFMLYSAVYLRMWGNLPRRSSYLLLGLAAAPILLLRLNSNSFIVLSMLAHFAWAAWCHRPHLRQYAWLMAGVCVAAAPIIPYLVYCKQKYNDPWYKTGLEARYFANIELAGKHPELPTREEFERENYAGGPMKMSTYLFRYHTLGQLLEGAWKGTTRLLVGDFARYGYRILNTRGFDQPPIFGLHLLGLAAYFLNARRRVLLGLFVLFHLPSLYLVHFQWFDPRLLTVAFVGFYVGCGLALVTAVRWTQRLVRAASPEPVRTAERPPRRGRRA